MAIIYFCSYYHCICNLFPSFCCLSKALIWAGSTFSILFCQTNILCSAKPAIVVIVAIPALTFRPYLLFHHYFYFMCWLSVSKSPIRYVVGLTRGAKPEAMASQKTLDWQATLRWTLFKCISLLPSRHFFKICISICIFFQGQPLSVSPWSLMIFGRSDHFLWSLLIVSFFFFGAVGLLFLYIASIIFGRRNKVLRGISQ